MNPPADMPDYRVCLPGAKWVLCESSSLPARDVRCTERHLHCVWHDSRLRPEKMSTPGGELIEVVHPGRWNREAGPDFLDAVFLVGPGRRRMGGDVEIHIRPSDWTAHGHHADPLYANVALHVTFFPGRAERLPERALETSLSEALRLTPGFCFEDIDLGAYPHAVIPREACPCEPALGDEPDRAEALLRAAGRDRILARARRMAGCLAAGDRHQVFYEETLAALGFKYNSNAFRRLARLLPVRELAGDPDSEARYARLLGLAGLLPNPDRAGSPEAAAAARRLWDRYWRVEKPDDIPFITWRLSGVRPLNHPAKRLAAAVGLFASPTALLDRICALPADNPEAWMRAAAAAFTAPPESPLRPSGRVPSIGRARAAAIVVNTVAPLMIAQDRIPEAWIEYLPGEQVSAPMREMAWRLLGGDHDKSMYARRGLLQQGLLQIHQDFCLGTRLGCQDCELPRRLSVL